MRQEKGWAAKWFVQDHNSGRHTRNLKSPGSYSTPNLQKGSGPVWFSSTEPFLPTYRPAPKTSVHVKMEFFGFGAQQVNITLFEKKQYILVGVFCNNKVGLKNYKMPIPSVLSLCMAKCNALYPKKMQIFHWEVSYNEWKDSILFQKEGGGTWKRKQSQVRKDRWMSKPVNAIYSDIKPIFEISAVFRYLQSRVFANSTRVHRIINIKNKVKTNCFSNTISIIPWNSNTYVPFFKQEIDGITH